MRPIGQDNLISAAYIALRQNVNVLLCGPPGYGKSYIAKYLAEKTGICRQATFVRPPDLRKNWLLDHYKVKLVVDEIHASKFQEEWIIFLDRYAGKCIFTSTNPEKISPALRSRCYRADIIGYNKEELRQIGGPRCSDFIVTISRGCPRNVVQFTKIFGGSTEENIISQLGLSKDAAGDFLFPLETAYLGVLKNIGGVASKTTLQNILKVDISEVEAGLLYLGKIKISSRGREIA